MGKKEDTDKLAMFCMVSLFAMAEEMKNAAIYS